MSDPDQILEVVAMAWEATTAWRKGTCGTVLLLISIPRLLSISRFLH
jgi:hypothetical protein